MKFGSFSVVLALLWTLSEADSEVVCVYGESCVLACSFPTGEDVLIHWKQAEAYVHSYYNQRDQLGNQDPAFRGRTSLFGLQIAGGNASLRLEGVRVQDEGRYQCNTSTTAGNKEAFTQLSVTAPVKAVRVHQEGNSLTCSSSWIYPEPELLWASSPPLQTPSNSSLQTPSNSSHQNQPRVQRTQQQLYNISSSLLLPEGEADGSYSCTVSTASSSRTQTLVLQGPTEGEASPQEWSQRKRCGIFVSLVVIPTLIGIIIFVHIWKKKKNRNVLNLTIKLTLM
ncbi:programmed cell death 1 ligand 1-like isoform 1-T1 [Menidia menidia]